MSTLNQSFTEELERNKQLLNKEIEKNRKLSEELKSVQTQFEHEKFRNQQYIQGIDEEIEKRDVALEKREQEVFELIEGKQKLAVKLELVKAELADEKQHSQDLAEQLTACQKQLQDERNKTQIVPASNETALFEAESKMDELRTMLENYKNDINRLVGTNCELEDRFRQTEQELARANEEIESLRSLVKCQQNEFQDARDQYAELQIQLHQLQSGDSNKDIAPQGNSLFAEVIDGKDKLEKQLALMHHKCQELRKEVNRATKLAFENAMNKTMAPDGEVLTGPTLTMFKTAINELNMRLEEKRQMLKKLHLLEAAVQNELMKMARQNPDEFNIFQESIRQMTLYEKQRLATRVHQLELRERDLLDALCFEKQQAASVSELKYRLEQKERMLAHYDAANMMDG